MTGKLTALELVLTFLTMLGPATKESLAAVCVLFEALLSYDYETGKFEKCAANKVTGVMGHLIEMAVLYGVQCNAKQLEKLGGRRAILRLILGPVIEELELNDLDRMRDEAVEAMMVLTFKPLDEVQNMLAAWAEQAVKDGRYQSRVYAWAGIPMEMANETGNTESSVDLKGPAVEEEVVVAVSEFCTPGLEIVFTLLEMFGPVTEKSIGATGVLFNAVLGYSEATRKFNKATLEMVPGMSEQLCSLAGLYGIRCEPWMLHTSLPAVLEDTRSEAESVLSMIKCWSLEEIQTAVSAWAYEARRDGRYQTRVSHWTGKPVEYFDTHVTRNDGLQAMPLAETQPGHGAGDAASGSLKEAPVYLEIATSNTVVGLVTAQALLAMDILPKQGATITTLFPTPVDVCLGRPATCSMPFFYSTGFPSLDKTTTTGFVCDKGRLDDAKELMSAEDEKDYHRMIGFQFPTRSSYVPGLDASSQSTPTANSGSPVLDQCAIARCSAEMAGWKKELQYATKQARVKEQKAMFEPHAAAWEDEQLSGWLTAIERGGQGQDQLGMSVDIVKGKEIGKERFEDDKASNSDNGMNILKVVGRLFGFA
ncbi:hypothetical protein RSOLAG1IB_09853 [Rhizoctonia solani AG-1 IB]|uniref:Uncharacterized protein n=2 Tax=Thanatephorus cucumeris (strain AG1-IB / isolate 7/3/14) TaxID=1108050 RepID=A0A0B7FU40_THACB|nr:hypothetical protein RSOLAG1IB_09853 [Rhizoctonia solani AG-1 IB]